MEYVAVIHARGGSVRVPKKNIRLLGNVPLIAWTIKAAINSVCNRVIVSTDSHEIAKIATANGAEVPFLRPKEISFDVPSELVTQHAIRFHEKELGKLIKIAVTIQPTTPFLTSEDINKSIQIMNSNLEFDSVFTAGPVVQRPEWMFSVENESGKAFKLSSQKILGERGVSQNLPELWHPNGGAYITLRKTLFNQNALIGEKPGIHKMDLLSSVDIDEEIDFLIAERILKYKSINF